MSMMRVIWIGFLVLALSACGFHLRGNMPLAKPLHLVYIESVDPYGVLVKELEQSLKMSHATVVSVPAEADTILKILRDDSGQDLLSVSGTQQTRQYNLHVTVSFDILDAKTRRAIFSQQTLTESRVITIQSNQILGSSNEANLYFQQMRRTLAAAIMFRISSREVTNVLEAA